MKKLLFATVFASTAIASSIGCNADSLTGLHFGLGVSVLFDKYETDVDVATVVSPSTANNTYAFSETTVALAKTDDTSTGSITTYADNVATALTGAGGTGVVIGGTAGKAFIQMPTSYIKHRTFNKRTTNCGGEAKLAYFHDFGNHLMIGVDLTGVIASKNKKTISVSPETISATERAHTAMTNVDAEIINITTGGTVVATGAVTGNTTHLLLTDASIAQNDVLHVTNMPALKAANPGFDSIMPITGNEPANMYLKTATDNAGELTFEKSVFNPRLAFIVGGTVYGWFADFRLGMSYTTGKVYATGGKLTGQGTNSKTVSISSPLIGLHLMKQMKIAGNNDAHLYLTADWNIGDRRRSVRQ